MKTMLRQQQVVGKALLAAGLWLLWTMAAAQNISTNAEYSTLRGAPVISNSASEPRLRPPPQQRTERQPRPERQSERLPSDARLAQEAPKPNLESFERYTETVTGNSLKIFGSNLFADVPSTFAPMESVQVNSDYLIGSGDELQIRGWGMVDIDLSVTVDRSGTIFLPRIGAVKVAGVRYQDLQGYLKKAVNRVFSNFELTVSLAQTRAVQVYVVGHALRPGTYTLSAMSTALNALFSSGGPLPTGSMRNIQVKRAGGVVTSLDLYDVLARGDKRGDVPLQDGDVIFIPEVGPLVALTGNVKTPAIYELKGKASVADLIGWAGGFNSAAETRELVVEKNIGNQFRTIAELIADEAGIKSRLATIALGAGDVLRVFAPSAVAVTARIENEYVSVSGEARQTGVFRLRKDETLRELMARLGGVNDNGYLYAMQVKRDSLRFSQQARLDEIADRFERDLESAAGQRIAGSTDKDAAAAVTLDLERQRRLAQRLRTVKAEGRIVLELADANVQVKSLPDLPLQNGDAIYVPRKPGTVDVFGSVFQPNSFIYRPKRSVKDYVQLAGGPTVSADDSQTYLIRADGSAASGRSQGWLSGVGGVELSPGDTVVVPEKIDRSSFRQSLKDWTAILYQFGLGAAGLKVLKD
jgi:polysaccharide export outer membrane protein